MSKSPADRRTPKKSSGRAPTATKSLGRAAPGSEVAKTRKSAAPVRGPGAKSAVPRSKSQDAKRGTTGRAKAIEKKKGSPATVSTSSRKAAGSGASPKGRANTRRSKVGQSNAPSSKKTGPDKTIAAKKRGTLAAPPREKVAATKGSGRTVVGSSTGKRTRNSGGKSTGPVAARKARAGDVKETSAKGTSTNARATAVAAGTALGAAASSRPGVERKAVKRASDDSTSRTSVAPSQMTGKRGRSMPGQDRDATRRTENRAAVKKAPVDLKRPELAAVSPAEAMTAAAMAPLIATTVAMRTAMMAATTAANAAMTSMSIGANLLSAGQKTAPETDAASVAEAPAQDEDEEKTSPVGGAAGPEK